MKNENENRSALDQSRAARRRDLEAAIREQIEGRCEFTTGDLRDLANLTMVRPRLKAMANSGVIVRLARDQWINNSRLSERESLTMGRSDTARKPGIATAAATSPCPHTRVPGWGMNDSIASRSNAPLNLFRDASVGPPVCALRRALGLTWAVGASVIWVAEPSDVEHETRAVHQPPDSSEPVLVVEKDAPVAAGGNVPHVRASLPRETGLRVGWGQSLGEHEQNVADPVCWFIRVNPELLLNPAHAAHHVYRSLIEASQWPRGRTTRIGDPEPGDRATLRVRGPSRVSRVFPLARAGEGRDAIDRLVRGWVGFMRDDGAGSARRECGAA